MAFYAPPPYTDITGISRAVMKDNAQETLANYNGNARPGELVVNLVVDPPALYIGNNVGQLTAVGTVNNLTTTTPTALTNLVPTVGARAFVSDGNIIAAGNFGAQIGSGGANIVPGWSDGIDWYVG